MFGPLFLKKKRYPGPDLMSFAQAEYQENPEGEYVDWLARRFKVEVDLCRKWLSGDFRGDSDLIGSWARDLISIGREVPEDYKELIFDLVEN
jgi:hypothetical protein